jgi:pimeloyl-ACP methyl ester carboxylesterase
VNVVLLHAWPVDERMWQAQLDVLQSHRVATPRLYGRGTDLVEWARQVLDETEGEFAVAGASMGGYVALQMARLAPERIARIALVGSRAAGDSDERKAFRDELIEKLAAGERHPQAAREVSNEELIEAQRAIRDRPDATETLRAFLGPLLVCVGDQDEVMPVEVARADAELAREGRLEVFEGAGHLLSLEQPDRFNRVLLEFLA